MIEKEMFVALFMEYETWCKKYGVAPWYNQFKKWVETEKINKEVDLSK